MRWYHVVFSCLFIFIATSALHSRTLDDTVDYLKEEAAHYYHDEGKPANYAKARKLYQQVAERGDAEAQFIVGGMLYLGKGGNPDRKNGFKWLLKAAAQGKVSPESLNIIGGMYLRGSDVPKNYLEAKKWLTMAAEQGSLSAQNDLAYLYFNGLGGERDCVKALELYEKSALQGDVMSQANAGLMYASGIGTKIDKARGYAWYSLASNGGNAIATINRNNLMHEMTWEELNRAQALSVELYQRIEIKVAPDPFEPKAAQK